MRERAHRAGVAALLGRPNAGKSTLLNRLLGEKLAIVTAKPQTTRSRILGILTLENAQVLLLDTPGLHAAGKTLNLALNAMAEEAAADCDVAVLLVDPSEGWGPDHAELLERLRVRGTPVLAVATQCDREACASAPWPPAGAGGADAVLRVSARSGEGLGRLRAEIVKHLPESPPLYPEDDLSDRSLRFLAAELVREAAFNELGQEIPYSLAVEVIEFDESRDDLVRIRATLWVERDSQKRIAVGRGGEVIKRIGTGARVEIEKLVGTRVFLDLRVKVDPKWSRRPKRMRALGYS